jgi:hypothetical protein
MADRDRRTLGDVRLPSVGGAEVHGGGGVEHEPRDQHPLGELNADMRLTRAGRDVPVDPANVVAWDVRPDLGELRSLAEER